MSNRIIVALDTSDFDRAMHLAHATAPHVGGFKVGMEFFYTYGRDGYEAVTRAGRPVVLDLKLKDIPKTVGRTVRSLCDMRPAAITVHADGGPQMVAAAVEAAHGANCGHSPLILAVTVLTSMTDATLRSTGVFDSALRQSHQLACLAIACGASGVVCSPHEVAVLREDFPRAKLMVPGIRPAGYVTKDQARTATPEFAVAAGADWIVVGRPITEAPCPALAAGEISMAIERP